MAVKNSEMKQKTKAIQKIIQRRLKMNDVIVSEVESGYPEWKVNKPLPLPATRKIYHHGGNNLFDWIEFYQPTDVAGQLVYHNYGTIFHLENRVHKPGSYVKDIQTEYKKFIVIHKGAWEFSRFPEFQSALITDLVTSIGNFMIENKEEFPESFWSNFLFQ